MSQPANTIALTLRLNQDFLKNNTDWSDRSGGNRADFQPTSVFLTDDVNYPSWSLDGAGFAIAGIIPRGTRTAAATGITPGVYSDAKTDPFTQAGTVSSHYSNQSVFTYADGHAKNLSPAAPCHQPTSACPKGASGGHEANGRDNGEKRTLGRPACEPLSS
jgi:hypothetical protein